MKDMEVARKILAALKSHYGKIYVLKDLARAIGFKGAHSKNFKKGLKFLLRKNILVKYKSGWSSENSSHHQTGVILMGDIYAVDLTAIIEDVEDRIERQEIFEEPKMKHARIQRFFKTKKCCECSAFENIGTIGFCKEFDWEIALNLAKYQQLCCV